MPNDSGITIILKQIETILIFLDRPIIQRQLIVLAGILLLTILASRTLYSATERTARHKLRKLPASDVEHLVQRWVPVFVQIYFPVIMLVLTGIAVMLFEFQDHSAAILRQAISLVLIILFYQLCVAVLYLIFPDHIG